MEGLFVYAAGMPNIWKKVRLEILGPFSATVEGNRFLVFAVDPYTYWTEGRPLVVSSPVAVARFVFSLFARLGRAELSVVGQKNDFCKQLGICLQTLLKEQDAHCGMGMPSGVGEVTHGRHGAEQVYHLPELPIDAGLTTGGMLLNVDGQVICEPADELSAGHAALFAHSDPINPVPRHAAFSRVTRTLKQRAVNYTNIGSDILSFVSSHIEDWDVKLDGYLYHLRTAVAISNRGYSAFHLAYGRNPSPITGRELMVRSLRGINEVLAFFNTDGADKKLPSHPVRPTCTKALSSDLEGTVVDDNQTMGSGDQSHSRETQGKKKKKKNAKATTSDIAADNLVLSRSSEAAPICQKRSSDPRLIIAQKFAVISSNCEAGSSIQLNLSRDGIRTPDKVSISQTSETHPAKPPKTKNSPRKSGKSSRRRKRGDILTVRCPICPNTYVTSQEELQLHLECHGEDGSRERIFKCPECAKVCKIWLNMVRHMAHHRDISSFRKLPDDCYKCKYCSKDFKIPECLREHVRVVHEGQKRFECHLCHEKFKVYKTKMRHMDIKHANITYTCDLCPYTTKVRRNLKQHGESHEKRDLKNKSERSVEEGVAQSTLMSEDFSISDKGSLFLAVSDGTLLDGQTTSRRQRGSSQPDPFHRLRTMLPESGTLSLPGAASCPDISSSKNDRANVSVPSNVTTEPSRVLYLSPSGSIIGSGSGVGSEGLSSTGMFTLQLGRVGMGYHALGGMQLGGSEYFDSPLGANLNFSLAEHVVQSL